jgi:hypothetical protein
VTHRLVLVLGFLVAVVAAAAGCSSSSEDGRTVAGRTGSAAPSVVAPDVAALTSLRLVTTTDGAATTARAEATLVVDGARGAALRFPGGDLEERLLADPTTPGRWTLAVDGAPADVAARFPAGTYAFVVETTDGSQPAVTVLLGDGPWPAPALVLGPADGSSGASAGPTIAWSWAGAEQASFDVSVLDDATGDVVYAARDVLGSTHALPAGTLAPGRAWRLVLSASTATSAAGARREARAVTRFSTAGTP